MRKTGRIFQAGPQRRSVPDFIRVKELMQEGKIGPLTEMHASVYVPSLNNNWLPTQPTPDPEQCDWNVWLGPAPWRPYNAAYLGFGWRGIYGFEADSKKGTLLVSARMTDGATFLAHEQFAEEVFGPWRLVVVVKSPAELRTIAHRLDGQLTATIHAMYCCPPLQDANPLGIDRLVEGIRRRH